MTNSDVPQGVILLDNNLWNVTTDPTIGIRVWPVQEQEGQNQQVANDNYLLDYFEHESS
jgi:hypothetical protein